MKTYWPSFLFGLIIGFTLAILVIFFILSASSCSIGTDVTVENKTPLSTPSQEVFNDITPVRYIDWQSEVVCYIIPNVEIFCLPGSETAWFKK